MVSDIVFSNNHEEDLARDLITSSGPSDREISKGDSDWLDGGNALLILRDEFYGSEVSSFHSSWSRFKAQIKHHLRFFDFDGEETRELLLDRIAEFFPRMEVDLDSGIELFRARVMSSDFSLRKDIDKLVKQLGPPPVSRSLHNRMSPSGISYFYLSNSIEACISEIRPIVGSNVHVARFE